MCPGCPLLAPLNDTKVVHAVDVALTAFNAQSNGSYFRLLEVSRAQLVVRLRPLDRPLGGLVAPREWGWANSCGGQSRCRGSDRKARRAVGEKGKMGALEV